jgi:hypothetical protein
MNHHKLPGVLVVLVLAAGLAAAAEDTPKKAETIEGRIMKVDPSGNRLTVAVDEQKKKQEPRQMEFQLGESTRFIFFAGPGGKVATRTEAYKNPQFKEGARVTIVSDGRGRATEVSVGKPVGAKK